MGHNTQNIDPITQFTRLNTHLSMYLAIGRKPMESLFISGEARPESAFLTINVGNTTQTNRELKNEKICLDKHTLVVSDTSRSL